MSPLSFGFVRGVLLEDSSSFIPISFPCFPPTKTYAPTPCTNILRPRFLIILEQKPRHQNLTYATLEDSPCWIGLESTLMLFLKGWAWRRHRVPKVNFKEYHNWEFPYTEDVSTMVLIVVNGAQFRISLVRASKQTRTCHLRAKQIGTECMCKTMRGGLGYVSLNTFGI